MNNLLVFIDKLAKPTPAIPLPFIDNCAIQFCQTSTSIPEQDLRAAQFVGIVLYEPVDWFEVIPLYRNSYTLFIATSNAHLLEKIKQLPFAFPIDLTKSATEIESDLTSIMQRVDKSIK